MLIIICYTILKITGLPTQDEFYNDLEDKPLSNNDYEHVQKVWREFGLRNLGNLHDLYVIGDVLLLADVFEKYRDLTMDRFQLDPLHFISLPSLTFDACLKLTKVELDIIKDVDMLQMFESGIRGDYLFINIWCDML